MLSKEQYCYKIDTLLTESSASSFHRQPLWITTSPFLQENHDHHPSMIFQKISTPLVNNKGVHTLLVKSKEFNKEEFKVQVKRAFKSCSFLSLSKKNKK